MLLFPLAPENVPYPEGLEDYVKDWQYDPIWDLYDCPDEYVQYKDLLADFQRQQETEWNRQQEERYQARLHKIENWPQGVLGYIVFLEDRIDHLREEIERLKFE